MVNIPRKRWLILTQYYSPEIGAPQIRLRCLANELREHGIDIEVLTALPNYPKGEIFPGYPTTKFSIREEIDGVPVRRVWIYPGSGKSPLIRLLNYLSFTLTALIAALFGPRPDVLFVESQPLSLGIVGLCMKWIRGVPYIYHVPDLQIDVARQMGFIKSEAFLRLALRLENLFLKKSWKVSTVTHRFIRHFEERGLPRTQITFLPNGADTRFLCPKHPCPELLDRWKLREKTVFVYVGTHAYYHGLDTLIHAAKLLHDHKDLVFLMIGNGPERSRIIQLAKDLKLTNVVFGQSPYEEMDRLYSISYASIATLRDLEVANQMRLSKVFPSLSCGVPVIYAGLGEASDVIRDNHCGMTVDPENPEKLAAAIEQLASDRAGRDSMGKAGRHLVEADYSWKIIVTRWIQELGISQH
ncbi:MAG: glycosyltransferase family 4 protein [Nitrospirales bacterium]|nr:glycosyltransferase family 4 protein [Nitrospirales bacterium]